MATVDTASTNFSTMVPLFYEKRLIEGLYPKTFLYKLAEKNTVPLQSGKTVYFNKYTEPTSVGGALTEGSVVTATELSASQVSVTLGQRGVAKSVSDLLEITANNPVLQAAVDNVLAPQAAITVDKEILWRLTGASEGKSYESVDSYNPNGATKTHLSDILDGDQGGLSSLYLSSDGTKYVASCAALYSYLSAAGATAAQLWLDNTRLNGKVIRAAVAELDSSNAITDGGLYDGVAHPRALKDIGSDPDFISWNGYGATNKGDTGIVGTYMGVRWWKSTIMPFTKSCLSFGSFSTITFSFALTLITGKGAFGVSELAGNGGVQMKIKRPDSSTTGDPLDQYSTVGFKITMGAVPLNKSCARFLFHPIV